jgi:hypothetical protein
VHTFSPCFSAFPFSIGVVARAFSRSCNAWYEIP